MPKIFCIGISKTGTSTFAECMRRFGLQHCTGPIDYGLVLRHERRFDELYALVDRYQSFDDLPWPLLYPELSELYPDSRFVLTVRKDTATWLKSWQQHCVRRGPTLSRRIAFGTRSPEEAPDEHCAFYERHNAEVTDFFAGTGRLLKICWENAEGWQELGTFLGLVVPDGPIPRRHAGASKDPRKLLRKLVFKDKVDHAERFARRMSDLDPQIFEYFIGLLKEQAEIKLRRKDREARWRQLRRRFGLPTRG